MAARSRLLLNLALQRDENDRKTSTVMDNEIDDSSQSKYAPSDPDSNKSFFSDEYDVDFEHENVPTQLSSATINLCDAVSTFPLTEIEKKLESSLQNAVTKAYKKSSGDRVLGKSYIGYERSTKTNKVLRVGRKQRMMSPTRCSHKLLTAKSNRTFLCGTFSEEDRKKAFSKFWAIPSWNEKKGFVRDMVSSREITRRRKNTAQKVIKNEGHDVFLTNKNGKKVRVCRNFFLKTLNLGEDMFRTWIKDDSLQNESPLSDSDETEDQPSAPPSTPRSNNK